ncbi:MAG TPA: 2Fe-2S iron-sulfur cluster-binding protein [Ignavibacteria bacterium]|nr:2Fe-2S iron-sulfur cluster-binding protein [Ignavibacteria bacterium]
MNKRISIRLNGKDTTVETDPSRKLLWVLRAGLGLTGTKYGCGVSYCGSCTVAVNNSAERSCQLSLQDVQGRGSARRELRYLFVTEIFLAAGDKDNTHSQ